MLYSQGLNRLIVQLDEPGEAEWRGVRTQVGMSMRTLDLSSKNRRGSSLGGALLAVTILATLAAGLTSLCVNHLRLSTRSDRGLSASNLARSVVAAGIARVLEDQGFGTEASSTT